MKSFKLIIQYSNKKNEVDIIVEHHTTRQGAELRVQSIKKYYGQSSIAYSIKEENYLGKPQTKGL